MKKITIAFASNNGETIIKDHFGEATTYLIYEINEKDSKFVKEIINTNMEEEMHSDPKKAKGIASVLKDENVNTLVSTAFGGNIKRMQKKFVCIIVKSDNIKENIAKIIENKKSIIEELDKGEERKYLKI